MPVLPKKKSDPKKQDHPEFLFHLEFNTTLKPIWERIPHNDHGFESHFQRLHADIARNRREEEEAYDDFCQWQDREPRNRYHVEFDSTSYQAKERDLLDRYYSGPQITSFCKILADELFRLSGETMDVRFQEDNKIELRRTKWSTTTYYHHRLLERGFCK